MFTVSGLRLGPDSLGSQPHKLIKKVKNSLPLARFYRRSGDLENMSENRDTEIKFKNSFRLIDYLIDLNSARK